MKNILDEHLVDDSQLTYTKYQSDGTWGVILSIVISCTIMMLVFFLFLYNDNLFWIGIFFMSIFVFMLSMTFYYDNYQKRIIVDRKKILYRGMLNKFCIPWNQVKSIGVRKGKLGIKEVNYVYISSLSSEEVYLLYPNPDARSANYFSFMIDKNQMSWRDIESLAAEQEHSIEVNYLTESLAV